jgi:hypothetical protein
VPGPYPQTVFAINPDFRFPGELKCKVVQLLTRVVGRPSHKLVVRYRSFFYQAASGKQSPASGDEGGVPLGEIFPRAGFTVTNLSAPNSCGGAFKAPWKTLEPKSEQETRVCNGLMPMRDWIELSKRKVPIKGG